MKKAFGVSKSLLIIVIIGVLGFTSWYFMLAGNTTKYTSNKYNLTMNLPKGWTVDESSNFPKEMELWVVDNRIKTLEHPGRYFVAGISVYTSAEWESLKPDDGGVKPIFIRQDGDRVIAEWPGEVRPATSEVPSRDVDKWQSTVKKIEKSIRFNK